MKQEWRKQLQFWEAASQPAYQTSAQRRSVEKGWRKWCAGPCFMIPLEIPSFHYKKQTQIISFWSSVSPQFCCVDVDVKRLWRSDNLRVPAAPPVTAGMDSSPPMTLIRNKCLKEDGWVFYISAFSAVLLFPVFQLPIFYFFLPSLFCHLSR